MVKNDKKSRRGPRMPTALDMGVMANVAYQTLLDTSHGVNNLDAIKAALSGQEYGGSGGAITAVARGIEQNARENAAKIIAPIIADVAVKAVKRRFRVRAPSIGGVALF